ncbi:hypothetical protein MMC15_005583 [Xylographa vitiligo]|nr:hypothetical protein [Xylographa vitiligo]
MKEDRFFVLPYSVHEKHIPSFMGRIVLRPLDPNYAFTPEHFGPQTIIPDILEDPIIYKSRADIINGASNNSIRAQLTRYFSIGGQQDKEHLVSMQSENVKRYQMTQIPSRFQQLMKDSRMAAEVRAMMRMNKVRKIYMVVGFLTTTSTTYETNKADSRIAKARATAPIGEALGLPAELDVALEGSMGRSVGRYTTGTVDVEEIFAVAYDTVISRHFFDNKSTPIHGHELRVKGSHLALGEDDSDQEIEDDSEDEKDEFQLENDPMSEFHEYLE